MATDWARERVLVTGGTGMLGANLLRRLTALGGRPFVFVRDPARIERIAEIEPGIECLQGDISDAASVGEAVDVARPGIVFHLASSFFNPPTLPASAHMNIITMGLLHLCEALTRVPRPKEAAPVRLVITGSCAVYAGGSALREDAKIDPGSMLGVAKAAAGMIAQLYARHQGIEAVELRLFTPYGPWEAARRLVPDVILSALDGRDVQIGHGGQQRDFIHVDDVIDALLLAAETPLREPALALNIGSGVGRPIREVAERILELMGNPVRLNIGTKAPRPDEIWEISADISAAARHLGWRPKVDFDEGLRRSIDWIRDNRALARTLR